MYVRTRLGFALTLLVLLLAASVERDLACAAESPVRILLLHHSTGECVWNGGVSAFFDAHNAANETRYEITELAFPKDSPYGWENYPYDYYNIWVKHAGRRPYRDEPTLEILTKRYDVIVFKHCFPVSAIEADTGQPDVASPDKRTENYKLQYLALKEKLRSFPKTRFLVWTGAALGEEDTTREQALRARSFFAWVRDTWDEPGDNVWVWDFFALETGGGLFLKPAHAEGPHDAHPNAAFCRTVAPLLGRRIVDVIEGRGDTASVQGRGQESPLPVPARQDPEPEPAPEPRPEPRAEPAPATGAAPWALLGEDVAGAGAVLWGTAATPVGDPEKRALRLDLRRGREEDWGEYGRHRVLRTLPGALGTDVRGYGSLVVRARADRKVLVPLALLTLEDEKRKDFQPHFAFTAYLELDGGDDWQTFVFDLAALELAVEGPEFYESRGKPERIKRLSALQLVLHERDASVPVFLREISFRRERPSD